MTMAAKVAAFFEARPNVWIDGEILARIAGRYAWRTRISDLRRAPWNLRVENRQRRVRTQDGRTFTVSEYRLVPHVAPAPAAPVTDPWRDIPRPPGSDEAAADVLARLVASGLIEPDAAVTVERLAPDRTGTDDREARS
jgi:hypothetical protein